MVFKDGENRIEVHSGGGKGAPTIPRRQEIRLSSRIGFCQTPVFVDKKRNPASEQVRTMFSYAVRNTFAHRVLADDGDAVRTRELRLNAA